MSTSTREARPLSEPLHQVQPGEGVRAEGAENPTERLPDWRMTLPLAQSSRRCGAKTRSGNTCRSPAVRGKTRCRLHGGLSTGPRTAEGVERIRKARTKHGRRSAEMIALRR